MRTTLMLAAVAAITFTGCAGGQKLQTDPDILALERNPTRCHSPEECEMMWAAARNWILSHSSYKIQTYSTDMIETHNPSPYDAGIAVRATKDPEGGGVYRIRVVIWCNNMFGCVPGLKESILSFHRTVRARALPTNP